MVGIKITIDEDKSARRKLKRLRRLIDPKELLQAIGNRHVKWMNENLKRAGLEIRHKTMADNTIAIRPIRSSPRHFSSRFRSRLSQSMTVRVLGKRAVVASINDEFAEIHHKGTGPYTIRPVGGGVLRFRSAQGIVFTRKVRHPGIPKRGLLPTKRTAERLAQQVAEASLKAAVRKARAGKSGTRR